MNQRCVYLLGFKRCLPFFKRSSCEYLVLPSLPQIKLYKVPSGVRSYCLYDELKKRLTPVAVCPFTAFCPLVEHGAEIIFVQSGL